MLKLKVLEIKQPFGVFYAAKISAYHLLRIAEADPFKVNEHGEYSGVQRKRNDVRNGLYCFVFKICCNIWFIIFA